jgi:hypothetical protein
MTLHRRRPVRIPKLSGADIELGNFVMGLRGPAGTGDIASRLLLREMPGVAAMRRATSYYYGATVDNTTGSAGVATGGNPQDWGRKFLPTNGGCAYIDLNHLELCIPEVLSAYDHVAAWHAMLRIARRALESANEKLAGGRKIHVLVNNSDGRSNSYGSHLNFLMSRPAWDNIFGHKLHQLLYLAAYQASSIVFTGQGKVGAENGAPRADFQIAQRADFFETLVGLPTTYQRPIVNTRDEALCGRWQPASTDVSARDTLARLHCIFFDSTLCHVATLLKVGVMQIVLAMIEADRINPNCILDDPLDALHRWSHDPTLAAGARTAAGQKLTAVELQLRFLEDAKRFGEQEGFDGIVPRAADILALWEDTLLKLKQRDFTALAPRLDWVLKLNMIRQAMASQHLAWDSPQVKHLDHLYGSLDAADGLYWLFERRKIIEPVVPEAAIEHMVHQPPEDTRAWTRAMLLRAAGRGTSEEIDWDSMSFWCGERGSRRYRWIDLANPLAFTRTDTERVFTDRATLEEILDALDRTSARRLPTARRLNGPRANGGSHVHS